MIALSPQGELTDEELDNLDLIDFNKMRQKHLMREDRERRLLRWEGAEDVTTTRSDVCLINGHRWVPERLHTIRCSTCWEWRAL